MSTQITTQELNELDILIKDIFYLLRKNMYILEVNGKCLWGDLIEKTKDDFNKIHNKNMSFDTLFKLLDFCNIFEK